MTIENTRKKKSEQDNQNRAVLIVRNGEQSIKEELGGWQGGRMEHRQRGTE